MPLQIVLDDITKMKVDAVVNAANSSLTGGGGVDGAIHQAAGPELLEECRTLGGCETGQAKITKGYRLPAKYIIHTVGPVWQGGSKNEDFLLENYYKNSLKTSKEYDLESIAFPLISSGAFGYSKEDALRIAISAIVDFLHKNDMTVFLVIYDKASFVISKKIYTSVAQYIDDNYVELHSTLYESEIVADEVCEYRHNEYQTGGAMKKNTFSYPKNQTRSIEDLLEQMDETFSQSLFRLIDEKGMTDVETYKRANIDRKLFSKIRSNINYKPGKPTAIAFAIALRLNIDETKDLLQKAGFSLSNSSKSDIIIQYFINNGNYNIFEINEVLFAFDQNLLGA